MKRFRLSATSTEPVSYEHAGIVWTVQPVTLTRWFTQLARVLSPLGKSISDMQDMTFDDQAKATARAMAGFVVIGFESFEIQAGDDVFDVVFDRESEDPEFDTEGEEFLASNEDLAQAILSYALGEENFRTGEESVVLGKSSKPSDSIDKPQATT